MCEPVQGLVRTIFLSRPVLLSRADQAPRRLQEKVIDIEVANNTPLPTVDPSVHTILIGHSMGGIVAADTVLGLASERPIDAADSTEPTFNSFMFPYIQGVLAFDTPYLGISPGVVAHGAEGHYKAATSAITQLSGLTGSLWGGKAATGSNKEKEKEPAATLPPASEANASLPSWQRWGKVALYAGAGAALAAGGTAAWLNRDQITEGWSWVGSHLEFVGCLMKGEELRKRVAGMGTLNKELKVGFGNLYTRLGKKALSKDDGSMVGSVIGNQRTFCNLPQKEGKEFWHEAINDEVNTSRICFGLILIWNRPVWGRNCSTYKYVESFLTVSYLQLTLHSYVLS
jgi:hypothetical protein